MRILLDVTRTIVHSRRSTPTGIDRVEHAYIRFLLEDARYNDSWFIVNTPYGRGALSPGQMRQVFNKIEAQHRDTAMARSDAGFEALANVLSRPVTQDRDKPLVIRPPQQKNNDSIISVAAAFVKGALRFHQLMAEKIPSVYLHTSHLQLDQPALFQWLHGSNLFPVFFIHDLIPIEFPEFCIAGAAEKHKVRMNTVLAHARTIVANSAFTRDSLVRHAGVRDYPPLGVVPLANTIRCFGKGQQPPALKPGSPFFLHVGTIEGRKNIGHLLNTWRHLLHTHGPAKTPRLVLVGRRGWECETVTSTMDRSVELANHVIEISDLSDINLLTLMQQASGLLTLSMTEGYGLPPVEARHAGLPVIASDIPAHREILRDAGNFVAIHDGEALAQKVMALARADRLPLPEGSLNTYTWDNHVEDTLAFIAKQTSSFLPKSK